MAIRKSNAVWNGGLQDGNGTMKLGSGAFEGKYSFSSRFEDGTGTNPEELLAAAHAGCFSMALAAGLGRAGFSPKRVASEARVQLLKNDAGLAITRIELDVEAEVPGIDAATFAQQAEATKASCIISRALSPDIQVVLSARLV
ncbi:MAG: OsmC family protein [Thermoanaerobaculia bacterium]